jgi:hypothetical protein
VASSAGGLVIPTILWTITVYGLAFALLNTPIAPPAATEGLDFILEFVGNLFNFLTLNVPGLPGFVGFVLFMTIAVPWTIIGMDVTGTVGDLILGFGLVVGAITKIFQWLF